MYASLAIFFWFGYILGAFVAAVMRDWGRELSQLHDAFSSLGCTVAR